MQPTDERVALPNLTVQQLEYLAAVHDHPTWAAAAVSLGVSPSALSQGIAELERRLGLTLFERRGRRQVATPDAGPVVRHARRVLAQTSDLARWAGSVQGGRTGRLRVGMIDAAAVDHFPEVLRDFRRERPQVELRLAVASSGVLLEQLRADRLDVVVCVAPAGGSEGADDGADDDLVTVPLLDEPLGVYAPDGRRVTDPNRWGPWVAFPAGSHTRALTEHALQALGARVDVVAESHQPEVLRAMVRLGMGWAVLPVAQAERAPDPLRRTVARPLAIRQLVAARRVDAVPDPLVAALVDGLVAASHPQQTGH